jgi:hypothetical protein
MMGWLGSWRMFAVGLALVLFGFLVPFLMVLDIIEPGMILGFASYAASIVGLLIGIVAAAWRSAGRNH